MFHYTKVLVVPQTETTFTKKKRYLCKLKSKMVQNGFDLGNIALHLCVLTSKANWIYSARESKLLVVDVRKAFGKMETPNAIFLHHIL